MSEKEMQPQLFPLGLVAMATEAFSARTWDKHKEELERGRDAQRNREREGDNAALRYRQDLRSRRYIRRYSLYPSNYHFNLADVVHANTSGTHGGAVS